VEPLSAPTIEEIRAARDRLVGSGVLRTPLIRLHAESPSGEIYLKLENLQPIGSFKLRGATSAMRLLPRERMARGVYTPSAGNMAQGVAWAAREMGIHIGRRSDHAPARLAARRLGGGS
jgi:threonine dehydratase